MKHYGDITKLSGYDLPMVDVITGGNYKVYAYVFPDGKIYIGMTMRSIQRRKDCGYQHNKRLKEAIKCAGWDNVEKVIIQEGMSKEEAESLERVCIKRYDATNPDKGYNVSYGGRCTFAGLHHTEEHKKYMSELYRGRVFSEAHIANMRKSHAKERKPVCCIDPRTGNTVRYKSLGDAAEAVGGYRSNISRACDEEKIYKGCFWRKDVM